MDSSDVLRLFHDAKAEVLISETDDEVVLSLGPLEGTRLERPRLGL